MSVSNAELRPQARLVLSSVPRRCYHLSPGDVIITNSCGIELWSYSVLLHQARRQPRVQAGPTCLALCLGMEVSCVMVESNAQLSWNRATPHHMYCTVPCMGRTGLLHLLSTCKNTASSADLDRMYLLSTALQDVASKGFQKSSSLQTLGRIPALPQHGTNISW